MLARGTFSLTNTTVTCCGIHMNTLGLDFMGIRLSREITRTFKVSKSLGGEGQELFRRVLGLYQDEIFIDRTIHYTPALVWFN